MHRVALWLSEAMENSEYNPLAGVDFNRIVYLDAHRAQTKSTTITTSRRKLLEAFQIGFTIGSRRGAARWNLTNNRSDTNSRNFPWIFIHLETYYEGTRLIWEWPQNAGGKILRMIKAASWDAIIASRFRVSFHVLIRGTFESPGSITRSRMLRQWQAWCHFVSIQSTALLLLSGT